jgi:hypothetical protein
MDCHDRAGGGEAPSRWLAVFDPEFGAFEYEGAGLKFTVGRLHVVTLIIAFDCR